MQDDRGDGRGSIQPFYACCQGLRPCQDQLSLLQGYPPEHNAISVASALAMKPLSGGAYLLLQRIAFSTLRHSAYVVLFRSTLKGYKIIES